MSRRFTQADINNLREKGLKIIDNRPPEKDRLSIPKVDCKEVQWILRFQRDQEGKKKR